MHPTTKFRQALPYALLPVSPSLAAFHTSRARIHTPQDRNSCSKCGSYLHIGTSRLRLVRSKSSKSRVLQTTCLACHHIQSTAPFEIGNTPSHPATRPSPPNTDGVPAINTPHINATPVPPARPTDPQIAPSPLNNEAPAPSPSSSKQSKSRPKKKTGLQDMLARNREKDKERVEKEIGKRDGLSAFLSGL